MFSFSKIDSTYVTIACFVWAKVIVWSLCVSFQCMCMQVDCSSRCPFFRFEPDCVAVVCSLCLLSTDLGKTSRKARIKLLTIDNLRHMSCRIQQKSVIQTVFFFFAAWFKSDIYSKLLLSSLFCGVRKAVLRDFHRPLLFATSGWLSLTTFLAIRLESWSQCTRHIKFDFCSVCWIL